MVLAFSQESADWKKLRRGWCWGSKGFREEMLELIAKKQGLGMMAKNCRNPRHSGWSERGCGRPVERKKN